MDEESQQELQDLTKLAEAESLAEDQKPRFNELKAMDLEEKFNKAEEEKKTILAQKEHFREKHEKLAKEFEELKTKVPQTDKELPTTDPLTLMKTVSALKDYSQDELDVISVFARGKGLKLDEAAKDEAVKLTIAAMREKQSKEAAVPKPQYSGVTFNKKPVHELSEQELKDNWQDVVNGVLSKKKGGTL